MSYTPVIPRFMEVGRHGSAQRVTGGFGARKKVGVEFLARFGITGSLEPNKHWSRSRLAKAGLRKVRHYWGGQRRTVLVPIEEAPAT